MLSLPSLLQMGLSLCHFPSTTFTDRVACDPLKVTNLENQFGEGCDFETNFRTPVGNCNNLKRPRQGAFNHALLRLPKHDPSYEDGATSTPRGPEEISPRHISNWAHIESKHRRRIPSLCRLVRYMVRCA